MIPGLTCLSLFIYDPADLPRRRVTGSDSVSMTTEWWKPNFNTMAEFSRPSSFFSDNRRSISSVFKSRPSRVGKTPSASNSPHDFARRRNTTAARPPRCRTTLVESPISALALSSESEQSPRKRSRPMSWHPTTSQPCWDESNPIETSYRDGQSVSTINNIFNTTAVNGLITPLAQPCAGEPISHGFFTLDDISTLRASASVYDTPYSEIWATPEFEQAHIDTNWQCAQTESFVHEGYFPHADSGFVAAGCDSGVFKRNDTPPTPDFLPIQNFRVSPEEDFFNEETEKMEEENTLVGMGLYDTPQRHSLSNPSLERSMATASIGGISRLGQGLKLEDSFNPSANPAEDEQDEEDEEASQAAQHSLANGSSMINRSFFFDA